MIKQKIKAIKDIQSVPCVSILLPTHRTAPDNQQDPILLKNLIRETERRLNNEFGKNVSAELVSKLTQMASDYNFQTSLDGLALYACQETHEIIRFPLPVKERIVINGTFATRDLYRSMHHQEVYFILHLQLNEAKLYDAYGDRVSTEVRNEGFPYLNDVPEPDDESGNPSEAEKVRIRTFLQRTDKRLQDFLMEHAARMVVVATEPIQAILKEITEDKNVFIGYTTPPGQPNLSDMAKKAWIVVEEWIAREKERAKEELADAVNDQRFASDLNDIWRAVNEGRGDILLVEEGYFQPAHFKEGHISLDEPDDASGRIDDIVDEIIELCIEKRGSVVFIPDGELPTFDRIGLITRY